MTSYERTFPHVALSAHAHNRQGMLRTDDAWLDARWADPDTRVLVLAGSRLQPAVDGQVNWISPEEAPPGTRVLLGEREERAHFAVIVDPASAPGSKDEWVGIRAVLPALAGASDEAPLVLHAVGLAEWHFATRFCPRCGGDLESRAAGHELRCTSCDKPQFPRTDPAVIMAVTHGEPGSAEEAILLGRQKSWPDGRWSTLAGFLEPGETLEDAVRREVAEEVGVTVDEVEYFGNQPWPLPASLMVGFRARTRSREINVDGAEIEEAQWFTRDQMRVDLEAGRVVIPTGVSISSSLLEHWYGGPLAGGW